MQPVSFDNDFECQNVVEEFTFEDEGEKIFHYTNFVSQNQSLNSLIQ